MRATDEFDNSPSRECCCASIQTGIVPIDCGDIHVPGGILGPAFAQKAGYFSLVEKVKKVSRCERYG